MPPIKMHADEVLTDAALVRRLLTGQFPQWADLPLTPVESAGTDNAIYRLGEELAVRLPRIDWAVGQVLKEHHWLPRFAPQLPLKIPQPLAMGAPAEGYPWHWSIYRWLAGHNLTLAQLADPCQTARDLARFILALQRLDINGGPLAEEHDLRGNPLATRDEATRAAIFEMREMLDTKLALRVWETAMRAPSWERAPVWFHGDLLRGNLLFERGHLSAVIDFGGAGVGDPACDLMIAWGLFEGESRAMFRQTLGVDDATWLRARGHALSQAVIFIPYYLHTNPVGVASAQHMLRAVLEDFAAHG